MAAGTATIVKRPQGYVIPSTGVNAIVYNNGYGVAVVSSGNPTITHGLTTGQYIYIYSLLGSYNGFWYVEVIDSVNFEIREYPTAAVQSFVNSGSITYFVSNYTHGYQCIHLPIVYKIKNTLWPTNQSGTSRTVSSFANDSGYVKLTLSGALDAFNTLNYVKISGASSSSVNGSFQILTKTSTSVITINLPYNAAYSFSGGSVILYYNNYKVQVNVWAGLNTSHPWTAVNPYKKILSLVVVPDNNNIIKLNVNQFLKPSQNIISNNLQLDTLPSNTDFFNQFYIEYQEMYDQSDGVNVTTYSADLVSDQSNFEGVAINAKLPFKSRSSGYLNDYLMNGLGKFLTIFGAPVLFSCQNNLGCYQDVSFINNIPYVPTNKFYLRQTYYTKGIQQATVDKPITNTGIGVYRINPDTPNCSYDRTDLSIQFEQHVNNENLTTSLSPWTNLNGDGSTLPFIYSSGAQVTFNASPLNSSEWLSQPFTPIPGKTYKFNYSVTNSSSSGFMGILLALSNSDASVHYKFDNAFGTDISGNGTHTGTLTIVADGNSYKATTIGVSIYVTSIAGQVSTLTKLQGTGLIQLTETKQTTLNCKCSDQSIMLSWLNQLGGFDYWQFNGRSTHGIDITGVTTQFKNIYTDWPDSWGEFANTVKAETKRVSFTRTLVRSQDLTTKELADAIATIKTSPLVQIVNSQYDIRTVLVDNNSFDIRKDGDKNWSVSFMIIYTDQISSQEL